MKTQGETGSTGRSRNRKEPPVDNVESESTRRRGPTFFSVAICFCMMPFSRPSLGCWLFWWRDTSKLPRRHGHTHRGCFDCMLHVDIPRTLEAHRTNLPHAARGSFSYNFQSPRLIACLRLVEDRTASRRGRTAWPCILTNRTF